METIEEQPKSQVSVTTQPPIQICLVGNAANDEDTVQAALSFNVPIIVSETGLEIVCTSETAQIRTVFVMDDFEAYNFEIINNRKLCILGPPALKYAAEMNQTLGQNSRPIYNYAMRGVVTCFTGIRKKDELTKMVDLIHSMGGCIKKDLSLKTTHLICNQSGGEKYQYAKTFRLAVVRPAWVYAAWSARDTAAFDATQENFTKSHKLKPFEGQKICFFGFPAEEHQHMVDVLLENGGICAELEDPECSHVVILNKGAVLTSTTNFLNTNTCYNSESPLTLTNKNAAEDEDIDIHFDERLFVEDPNSFNYIDNDDELPESDKEEEFFDNLLNDDVVSQITNPDKIFHLLSPIASSPIEGAKCNMEMDDIPNMSIIVEPNERKRRRSSIDSNSSVDSPANTKKPKLISAESISRTFRRSLSFVLEPKIPLRTRRSSVTEGETSKIMQITGNTSTISLASSINKTLAGFRKRLTKSNSRRLDFERPPPTSPKRLTRSNSRRLDLERIPPSSPKLQRLTRSSKNRRLDFEGGLPSSPKQCLTRSSSRLLDFERTFPKSLKQPTPETPKRVIKRSPPCSSKKRAAIIMDTPKNAMETMPSISKRQTEISKHIMESTPSCLTKQLGALTPETPVCLSRKIVSSAASSSSAAFTTPFISSNQAHTEAEPSQMVVDEHTTTTKPEPNNKYTLILKSDWFWYSIQNGFANEKDYLFGDYLDSIANTPNTADRPDSLLLSINKRKRKRISQRLQLEGTPLGSGKRRSSVSDAGLLSGSSFFDCTTSPDKSQSDKLLMQPGETEVGESSTPGKKSMRFNHFMDFFTTESNYVGILDTILNLFKNKLDELAETENDSLLNKSEIKSIFGNFLPIHGVHQSMLEELKKIQSNWREDCLIGDIIIQHRDELIKAYPPYVNFYEKMKEQLQRCDREYPRFHAFLKINQLKPECGRQSLGDLMIRPVQRLPSISLLLNDILKHTNGSNVDHGRLEEALKAIKQVMLHINEDKRRTELRMAMFDIFNDIEGCPAHLVSSNRNFISKCEVNELSDSLSGRGDNLLLMLFSDSIELCKRKSRGFNTAKSPSTAKTYKHIKFISLNTVRLVIDITDSSRAFGLLLRDEKENLYTFSITDDEMEKSVYVKNLYMQIAAHTCRTDANNILLCRTSKELQVDISDTNVSTLSKAFKLAAKTRLKVGRAFSFNKTPNKLKRAVSTITTSPFGSTNSLTPASQLAQMRLASCTNINEVDDEDCSSMRSNSPSTQSVPPLSVQPTRKNKPGVDRI